ncbi:MAG: type II toxin-antitoxin system mRNA interferase toxin, RelE/StbE family [Sulfurimonas sp.]|nr:type II toxin-antitoxin system mRNA interferase toxin, RelE/StbE family [Sulfurimonas sp.]
MSKYQIAETKTFEKVKKKIDKKLKDNLEGYYRYRIGNYRLFYLVEDEKLIIIVVDFRHRQKAYE